MKVGFIGLGKLGRAMVNRLLSQGVELTVWNRTREKAAGLAVQVADTPADVASSADTVVLNLFDSDAVGAVLEGDGGLLRGDCRGKIIVDTTTNHFEAVPAFYESCTAAEATYLEAPVLGSVVPAAQGKLTILVSGSPSGFERSRSLLERLGSRIFFLEKPTMATRMKLVNNLALGSFMVTIAEALVVGESLGLSREEVLDILAAGGGNSGVLRAKRSKLIDADFSPQFAVEAIYKDLGCLQDLARDQAKPLFMGSMARGIFGLARARGMAELDFSAVHRVLSES